MKKYIQITLVLGAFFLMVFLRNVVKGEAKPAIGVGNGSNFVPNPTNSPQTGAQSSTSSPSQTPQAQTGNSSQSLSSATPAPTSVPAPTPTPSGAYKNGTYTGTVQDAFYGYVQVQVVVSGGRITAVNFLQYPNDNPTSSYINSQAMPLLQQEVIQAQSGNVNMISGASATSQAFLQSIADALSQAK